MLVVVHDWVGVDAEVEQLDGAITAGGKQLVLVDLGPCQVVQCVVCVEPEEASSAIETRTLKNKHTEWGKTNALCQGTSSGNSRLLYLDSSSRQTECKQTAVAHDAEVGGRGNSHPIVIVWRVLDGIWIEAPCAELKHSSHVECDGLSRPCDRLVGFSWDNFLVGEQSGVSHSL